MKYLITALLLFLTACAGENLSRLPDPHQLSTDPSTSRVLVEGRDIYVARCAKCHERHLPWEKTPEEWPKILDRHRSRVTLTSDQFKALKEYIITSSTAKHD